MKIDMKLLEDEKVSLQKDFEDTQMKIKNIESTLVKLKNNLNAIYGAIQQNEKMILRLNEDKKPMPIEKEQALNIATS